MPFDPDAYLAKKGGFDPDEYLKDETPKGTSGIDLITGFPAHFWETVKATGAGMVDQGKELGRGVSEFWEEAPKDRRGPMIDAEGLERIVRGTPGVGQAIEWAEDKGAEGYGGAGKVALAKKRAERAEKEATHRKDHPISNFLHRSIGVLGLPAGVAAQTVVFALDGFSRSIREGNDPLTALRDASEIALMAGGAHLTGKGISGVGKVAAKEMGIHPNSVQRQRARGDKVRAAQNEAEKPYLLKEKIDERVGPIRAAVDEARRRRQEGIRENKAYVKDAHYSPELEALTPQLSQAQAEVQWLKQPPIALGSEISEAMARASEEITNRSLESFNVLIRDGVTINGPALISAINGVIAKQNVAGVTPQHGLALQAVKALEQFKQTAVAAVNKAGGLELPAARVKEMIMDLDENSVAAYTSSGSTGGAKAAEALASVRSDYNEILRTASEPFRKVMDQLAPRTNAKAELYKIFPTPEAARSGILAMGDKNSNAGMRARDRVRAFDQAFGTDWEAKIDAHFAGPRENLARIDGEHTEALAQKKLAINKAKETSGRVNEWLSEAVAAQQNAAHGVRKLGPDSTERFAKQVGRGLNAEAEKQLKGLDPELYEHALDVGAARDFSKSNPNGSRRAKWIGGVVGSAGGVAGSVLGGLGLEGGAQVSSIAGGFGAGLGAMADLYGGKAVQTAIDMGVNLEKWAKTPYIKPLMHAAKKGPQALAIAKYLLSTQPGAPKDD